MCLSPIDPVSQHVNLNPTPDVACSRSSESRMLTCILSITLDWLRLIFRRRGRSWRTSRLKDSSSGWSGLFPLSHGLIGAVSVVGALESATSAFRTSPFYWGLRKSSRPPIRYVLSTPSTTVIALLLPCIHSCSHTVSTSSRHTS